VKDPVDGQETLAYIEKVMDDVINLLLSRVHMYKVMGIHHSIDLWLTCGHRQSTTTRCVPLLCS